MTRGSELWLSDEEQRAWRQYLRASRLLETALDRDLVQQGMSLVEYEILSMLSEAQEARMRMSALADLVVQSRSRVSHTAARLEKRGWVERQRCDSDSRGVELVLTPDGRKAVMGASHLHVQGVRKYLLAALTARQFATLGETMDKVETQIRKLPTSG